MIPSSDRYVDMPFGKPLNDLTFLDRDGSSISGSNGTYLNNPYGFASRPKLTLIATHSH